MSNKQKPTVAIVIPAYDEAISIRACLDSIAKQTVQPDEVIVVNNNSQDATAVVVAEFPFVTLINERQQGIAYARDTGFNAVKSDIIGRIDADSRLKPGWVEHIQHYYGSEKHINNGVSGQGYFYNLLWPKIFGRAQHLIAFRLNRLIMGGYILWGSNMAIPRTVWEAIRREVHQQPDIHEDIDLAIHMQRHGYHVDYRKSLLVGVRMRRVHADRKKLWANLMLWPRTFRMHGFRLWPIAFFGSILLFLSVLPALFIEKIAIMCGKQPGLKRRRHF